MPALCVCLGLLVTGCATHQHFTYFAPQGPGKVLNFSNHPPGDTLELMVLHGRAAHLRVSGRMLDEKGRVTLVVVFNDDALVQFTGREVHFRQGGKAWSVTSEWAVTQDPKKKPVMLPFDAPLPRTSYYGSYTTHLPFPDRLDPARPFELVLPATAARPEVTITFTPKVADFWYRPGV